MSSIHTTNGAKWKKEQQELDILLQNSMLQYLSVKEVVRTWSLVSRKHHSAINENVDLMMLLIGYDFGEIFEKCHALKEQLLNREITNYQCLRLLYTQFDTLTEIRHSNGRLPSLSIVSTATTTSIGNNDIRHSIAMVSDNNMASVDDDNSNNNSNDKNRDSNNDTHNKNDDNDTNNNNNNNNISVNNKRKSKINNDEMEMSTTKKKNNITSPIGWDFSHLIGLRKSGCVLHWLKYMQNLYQNSEHCHSPCEITCDGHGIVQIQPIVNARSASLDHEKTPLNDSTKISASKKESPNQKIVLSCALDLWTLCWRQGFTAQELTKLQQGLMRFEFRRW